MARPNSTAATKLLRTDPYILFVLRGYGESNDARAPQLDEAKPTGRLGLASSKGCTMSSVRRWYRLISPHGVCHRPKSRRNVATAAARPSRRSAGVKCPTK